MDKPIDQFEIDGLIVKLYQDIDPPNPCLDYDDPAVMVCWHRRYTLGHKEKQWAQHWPSPLEFMEWAKRTKAVVLPLYLLDHSGLAMSTGSFNDPWDSGQVGFIYWDKMQSKKCGCVGFRKDRKIKAMKAQVETYNQYLQGDVYGYTVENSEGEQLDSLWGLFGWNYAQDEARSAARYQAQELAKKASMAVL